MELISSDLATLGRHLELAKICGIESLALKQGIISGCSETRSAIMVSECDLSIPDSVTIGINNVDTLLKRIKLFKNGAVATLDLKSDNKTKSINFVSSKTRISYRCVDASRVETYSAYRGEQIGSFCMDSANLAELKQGISALAAPQYVYLEINRHGVVKWIVSDDNNDEFELTMESPFTSASGEVTMLKTKYDCRGPLLKSLAELSKNSAITINITPTGTMMMEFEGVGIYLVASTTSDDYDD